MANKSNVSSQRAADGWFMQASTNCFQNLKRSSFLLLFLAPMCLPHNKNYGKTQRTPGRPSGARAQTPEQIARNQEKILDDYHAVLEAQPEDPERDVAGRARALADRFKDKLTQADVDYIGKGNCQAERYLSVFAYAPHRGRTARQVMDRVVALYTPAVRYIFAELPAFYNIGIQNKTKDIRDAFPAAILPEDLPAEQDRLAWLLCAELILLACRDVGDWNVAQALGLIDGAPPQPEAPSKARVHLPAETFYSLCAEAMYGLKTADDIQRMLLLLQQHCPKPLDRQARSLARQLYDVTGIQLRFLFEQTAANPEQMTLALPDINLLAALQKECLRMMEQ